MTRFFTADQHFGHKNIVEYCKRPFDDVNHMNEELVKRWNEVVRPGDEVYVLGDVSLNPKLVGEYYPRLNGYKYLVPGNHDMCHPCHGAKSEKFIAKYLEMGFDAIFFIIATANLAFGYGTNVILSYVFFTLIDDCY